MLFRSLGDFDGESGAAAVVVVGEQTELAVDVDLVATSGRPALLDPFEKAGNVPFRVDLSRKEEVAVSPEPERISGAKPKGPP